MTSPLPLPERLGYHIKRAERSLGAAKTAALKDTGLTVPQYGALMVLAENPGISAAALSRTCGVTPPTMNNVLKNLQERGFVERSPHPWHRNVLETRLTDAGRSVAENADTRAVRVERALAAEFTEAEGAALTGLLDRCVALLDSVRDEG